MRGNPLWQVICVALLFAAAGFPVWRLTRPSAATATPSALPPSAGQTEARQTLEVQASFIPAPEDFKLTYLGDQTVLSGQGPTADFTERWNAQIPTGGADLALQARWPEGTPGHVAARILIHFPDGRQTEKTFFGEASERMVEIVSVGGKE